MEPPIWMREVYIRDNARASRTEATWAGGTEHAGKLARGRAAYSGATAEQS